MKRVKSIQCGAMALALAAGSAIAQPDSGVSMEPFETDSATTSYDVDENRDGRSDRMLILEQSDSLA
jgi:hypothetical protein